MKNVLLNSLTPNFDIIVEELAKIIYGDSYTQYGTCSDDHWKKTSELQREFCRVQARAALTYLQSRGCLNNKLTLF